MPVDIYIVIDFTDPRRLIADNQGYNQEIKIVTTVKEEAVTCAREHYEENKKFYDDPHYEDRVYVMRYEDGEYDEPGICVWDSAWTDRTKAEDHPELEEEDDDDDRW